MIQNKMRGLFYCTMHTPIVYTAGIVIYCILLQNGVESEILKSCIAVSPVGAIVFFCLSRWLSFCWVHTTMIIHAFFSNVCMLCREINIIHEIITTTVFRLFIMSTGILLILSSLYIILKAVYEGKKPLSFYCPNAARFIKR